MHVWCYASLVRWFFGALHLLSIIFLVGYIFCMMNIQDVRGEVLQQGDVQTNRWGMPHPKLGGRALDEWKTGPFCPSGGEDGGLHSSAEWQEESPEYWLSQSCFFLLQDYSHNLTLTQTFFFVFVVQRIFCWKFSFSLHHFVLSCFIALSQVMQWSNHQDNCNKAKKSESAIKQRKVKVQ